MAAAINCELAVLRHKAVVYPASTGGVGLNAIRGREFCSAMCGWKRDLQTGVRRLTPPSRSHSRCEQPPTNSQSDLRNAECSMDRLPTEVFQYLLTIVSDGIRNGFEPWDVYTLLVRLRLVSHSWMDAIDSHPPLWTLVTNRHGEQLSQLAIERSGALPLHIDFWYSSSANPRQYINAVVQLAPRWLSLSIAWEGYKGLYHEALGSLLLTRAPHLERIRFKGLPSSISTSVHLFDNAAPKLHTAIMDQSFLPNSWKSFLTSDLRCLVLRWMSGVRERDLEGLVQVIAASPGLEELELVGWWPVGPINVVPVRRDLTLDRLGKLRIRKFPWQWALSLLDSTHIPQTCISDISLDVSEAGPQVDGAFKLFKTELHQAASLAITLDKSLSAETVGLACTTRHASRTEIKFTWSPSDQPGEGPSSLVGSLVDEISKEVQDLHLPLSLYIACEFPKADHTNATESFLSSLAVADPLLPSVTRVKLKGWSLSLFLEHSKLHQFTSLSTLEIESVKDESLLNDLAKWIRARSQPAKSGPNAVMLKTITLPCKKLRPAVMNNLSLLLGDLVDLNWY